MRGTVDERLAEPYPPSHLDRLVHPPVDGSRPPERAQMIGVVTANQLATALLEDSARRHHLPVLYMVTSSRDISLRALARNGTNINRIAVGKARFALPTIAEIFENDPLVRGGGDRYWNDIPEKRTAIWEYCRQAGLTTGMIADGDIVLDSKLLENHARALPYGVAASCAPTARLPGSVADRSALNHAADVAFGSSRDIPVFVSGSNLSFRVPPIDGAVDPEAFFIPSFAPLYGEDWVAFHPMVNKRNLVYAGECTQLDLGVELRRVMTPERAFEQEGADTYVEGIFWLAKHGLPATTEFFAEYLQVRRSFIASVVERLNEKARAGSTPLIYAALETAKAAAARQAQITPQQCVNLHRKVESWHARTQHAVADGSPLAEISWLHIGKDVPRGPGASRVRRSSVKRPVNPVFLDSRSFPMRLRSVAEVIDSISSRLDSGLERRFAMALDVQPSAIEVDNEAQPLQMQLLIEQMAKDANRRESRLSTFVNEVMPLANGLSESLTGFAFDKSNEGTRPFQHDWNEFMANGGARRPHEAFISPGGDSDALAWLTTAYNETSSASGLIRRLQNLTGSNDPRLLPYAEVIAGHPSVDRRKQWATLLASQDFEKLDEQLLRTMTRSPRSSNNFVGSTLGFWGRNNGYHPPDLRFNGTIGTAQAESIHQIGLRGLTLPL